MYVVTGGAGFIGSALVWGLNQRGIDDILVVDRLYSGQKWKNLRDLEIREYVDKETFRDWVQEDRLPAKPEAILHMGACSSTRESDADYLMENNYRYTLDLARYCLEQSVRFIYASSAATYGDGSQGYSDDESDLFDLQPLNKYGFSKQQFDEQAALNGWLDRMVGLKFFNVYGPNEYHKGDMRSVQNKSYPQARDNGVIRLFKSHRDDYEHGQQERDFLYVKDAVKVVNFFLDNPDVNGIYNVGCGDARTFDDLAEATFRALDKSPSVEYFDMPEDLRPRYQYHTEAELKKLRKAGYEEEFTSLEEGIDDYVNNYLETDNPYLTP